MNRAPITKNPNFRTPWAAHWPSQQGEQLTRKLTLVLPAADTYGPALSRQDPSDEFLREVVSACVTNVAVLDESGATLFASESWRSFERAIAPKNDQHAPNDFAVCSHCLDSAGPQFSDVAGLKDDILRFASGGQKEFQEKYFYHGAARHRHFTVQAARLIMPSSGFRVLMTYQDMASPQEELIKTEERLTELLEKTKIFVWEAELESRLFTYVSEQAEKILGYPVARWYGRDFFSSNIHPSDRKRALTLWQREILTTGNFEITFRMRARNGAVVWMQNLVSVIRESGKPARMHGFMIDITERKRAQEAMRDLGARLIAAQEDERSRIARELHDDLNQRMALLSIELDQLGPEIEKPRSLRRRVTRLQQQVREISADIHRLSYRLHPSKLDQLGLGAAVKSLCAELSDTGQLRVDFFQKGLPAQLSQDVTLCIFRVIQEALRNCVKHSGALDAQVLLERTGEQIRMSVNDSGRGFDPKSGLMEKGLGFISMKERLRLVEGEIQIYSQPLRGTRIQATVPLRSDTEIN